jgi:Tol biopolymer transport system component
VRSIAWNRSGTRVAFSDSPGRVFVMGADGGGLRAVARFAHANVQIDDWSADGRMLAVDTAASDCRRGKQPGLCTSSAWITAG